VHGALPGEVNVFEFVVVGLSVFYIVVNVLIGCAARTRSLSRNQGRIDLHIFPIFSLNPVEVEAGVVDFGGGGPFNNYFLNVKIIHVNVTTKINIRSRKIHAFLHLTYSPETFHLRYKMRNLSSDGLITINYSLSPHFLCSIRGTIHSAPDIYLKSFSPKIPVNP